MKANHESASLEERPRVLIVEDEVLIRMVVADALRERGFSIVECESADEAWRFLQSGLCVDLVFTDVRLPGVLDGLELVGLVQANLPHVKAVVTSGHLQVLPGSPEVPFVGKPYRLDETAELLWTLITGD